MQVEASRTWRALFVVGGLIYFIGAFFHPRGMTMSDMLVDPQWIPSHAGVFFGLLLLTLGLVSFRRTVPPSSSLRTWLTVTLVLAVLQLVEMALHTMAYVDAGALTPGAFHGGMTTPVLTLHLWVATLTFTPFAIALLGFIWTGQRERLLGSPWVGWLGMLGAVAYGIVMLLVFIFQVEGSGVLFPIAHLLVPLWFVLAGVWPARQRAGVSGGAVAVGG